MLSLKEVIKHDCQVLLERALKGCFICAFGEDGFGLHGAHDIAKWFKIDDLVVVIIADDEDAPAIMDGCVHLYLEDYDSKDCGFIYTDKNFEIALKAFLKGASIDPNALTWPTTLVGQGQGTVKLDINIPLLLGWI